MEGNPSYFLFCCFEHYKTPAVPHFSTLSRLKPQSYLYLELYIDYPHTPPPCPPLPPPPTDEPYFSIFNRIEPEQYTILAILKEEKPSRIFIFPFK